MFKIFKNNWKNNEYFDEEWKKRIFKMSQYICSNDRVLDIGCGKMWLKEYLSESNKYFFSDYVSRGEGCIIADLNKKQFPKVKVDIAFVSGVLEYVKYPNWFIEQIRNYADNCVISYCTTDYFSDQIVRKSLNWINSFSKDEIEQLFKINGFVLKETSITETNNQIFYFEK